MDDALEKLVENASGRKPLAAGAPLEAFRAQPLQPGKPLYANQNERLNIDFTVDRLPFPDIQVMDPRVVRIPPGRNNEWHKHAHETLFVVLSGEGEVRVGEGTFPVKAGEVAYVPRWIFHQTRNTSTAQELVVLAITDFGFTSAVLGDYDRRTRLSVGGTDAAEGK
ncbi:MAG: cupin domain-containing protein [Deltaproteobacteria bacterium]|nr:cupin domain-containing protein [Deltaproteobacteria bacterium]